MKVDNIILKEITINYENEFKDILLKNKHLLPTKNKYSLSFDLLDSNESFANGIRRIFNDELLVKCLDVHLYELNTNDKYILPDNIKERINLIPLDQSINEDVKFNLNVINNTNDIIYIYTKDLINKNKNDTKVYFNKNIQICYLKPNKFINLANIIIIKGYGYDNSVFTIGSYKYQAINTDFNIPTLVNNLKDFHIEFINNANIDMKTLINNIYDNLYIRLVNIQTNINEYDIKNNSNDISKLKNNISIISNKNITDIGENSAPFNDLYEIHINHEYHTMGNLITQYVYLLTKDIELINYKLEHILTHKIIISIKHPEYKKLINDAINNIIKDLKIFKNTIINNI